MKRNCTSVVAMIATLLLASCGSSNISQLKGEWAVVEANGMRVNVEGIYLGFNPETGYLYGFTGCNDISGHMDKERVAGRIEFDDIKTTHNVCADSSLEMSIQSALDDAETFKLNQAGDEVKMFDEYKRTILQLKKYEDRMVSNPSPNQLQPATNQNTPVAPAPEPSATTPVATTVATTTVRTVMETKDLEGEWTVIQVKGIQLEREAVDTTPFLHFDIAKRQLSGSLGCNNLSARLEFDRQDNDYDPTEIGIEAITTTRMSCKNMNVERILLKELDDIDHFYRLEDGKVGLYNDERDREPSVVLLRK